MKLEKIAEIWGISLVKMREYQKKYKFWVALIYFVDIIIVSVLVAILYNFGASASIYMTCIILVSIIFTLCMSYKINTDTGIAFSFYKKYKHKNYKTIECAFDQQNLYNILYCIGYKRLKSNKTIDIYKEMLDSACCENAKNAFRIMKYIEKYKLTEQVDDSKETYLVNVLDMKKSAYLGFTVKESAIVESSTTTEQDENEEKVKETVENTEEI